MTGAGGNDSGANTPSVEIVCVDKQNNVSLVWIDMASGKVAGTRDMTRITSLGESAWGTSIVKAHDIIGKNVKNPRGESLGEIEDLAIDATRGRIAYAVLAFGGIMGINEKQFLVPWSSLASQRGDAFILDVPQERLKNAPGFDPKQWPNLADVELARTVHTYYNQPPYWELSDDEVVRSTTVVTLAPVYKGSDFIGRKVINPQNENLGKIEDLAIDPHSGRIAYAVLSFGGFLGINDKLFAIPWSSLSHTADGKCVLDVDKERLKNAPGFDKSKWPDMANPEWSRSVQDFYRQPVSNRPAR
jgi:sporulation protein YlmC with PRC-barrel domain